MIPQCTVGLCASLLLAALAAVALPAHADIFSFTDERGVVHFTNIPGNDGRFKLVRREGGSAPRPLQTWMPTEADIRRYQGIVDAAAMNLVALVLLALSRPPRVD